MEGDNGGCFRFGSLADVLDKLGLEKNANYDPQGQTVTSVSRQNASAGQRGMDRIVRSRSYMPATGSSR